MGYLDISMNVATVMVASVALGIVDDDTIHFINRYRREVSDGATTDEAIERATIYEGRASLTTAIINSCGFAVLFLSEYKPTAWFGGLLALTMGIAFLAEVFILPPLIKLLPRIYDARVLRRPVLAAGAAVLAILAAGAPAAAQTLSRPTGNVSLFGDLFPNRDTAETRARVLHQRNKRRKAESDRKKWKFDQARIGDLEWEAVAAFLGKFKGVYVTMLTFPLQFLFTAGIVRRLGVGGGGLDADGRRPSRHPADPHRPGRARPPRHAVDRPRDPHHRRGEPPGVRGPA